MTCIFVRAFGFGSFQMNMVTLILLTRGQIQFYFLLINLLKTLMKTLDMLH